MTNVPPIQWTPTGLIVPSAAAVLAGVQADLNQAFGGNLNMGLNTPQGQLASSLAAIIVNANAALAYFVNQVNPLTASGFMQDAIGEIYFMTRIPGAPTAVQCQCVGVVGTVIPAGALANDTSGNQYSCQETGTIPSGGSITLPFANVVDGPIPCPSDTLTIIYQSIPGWESINNSADGVVGSNVESQAAFELRREASVAANGQGSGPSIYGAVFDVPGVIDVYYYENDTSSPITVGSTDYSMVANSIYVGVVGGAAAAIAQAIYTKKSPGCNMNGNTTVTVYDESGYTDPIPSYSITFNIPTATPIKFAVELVNNPALPSNIDALVQNAIIAQFTGANGAPRARIGALITAAQFIPAILAIAPGVVQVLSCLIGTSSATLASVQMGIDQAPTIVATNISVTLS